MPSPEINTNYFDDYGTDLGKKLISKDYLLSVYPQIGNQITTPELWVWGQNSSGQLGDNTTTTRSTPVTTFAGGANWKSISFGKDHCSAIKTDGTLWTWGYNLYGQIGDNTIIFNRVTPVTTFSGGTNWKQVSCGTNHIAAIKTDGTLWSWGDNTNGQLGDNTTSQRNTPVTTFAGGTNWKSVSCGNNHTAAIKTDGTLWAWGYNIFAQLGDNTITDRSTPVTTFAGGTDWKQVSCGGGSNHTAAIKTDGTLWSWGSNSFGQLGDNTITVRSTPVTTFSGGTNWKQVSYGNAHTAAIKTDGTLWIWGINSFGALGDNTGTNRSTPVTTFVGGTNWKQVFGGGSYTAAIKTDGTLWTWGSNSFGQLGDNTLITRSTPVTTFSGGINWKSVSCGRYNIVAIISIDSI